MLNDIKNGLAAKINEVFGEDYRIYTEEIEEELQKPSFFLLFLTPKQKQVIGKRYFKTYPMVIRYLPSTVNKNEEMNAVADRLYDALEYISVGDSLLRGTNINHEVIDGVLRMYVEFNMFVLKKTVAEELMENAQLKTRV
jgi:hypothetical protein